MEGLKVVADLFRPGKFMCNLVLKDAYFTVPLHSRSQKLNHFQFQGKIYQFNCLPFGLSSAPRIFTKRLNPATGIPKKMGIPIIIYLDDMLILNSTLEGAREDFLIKLILGNLGFLINIKKSTFIPVQVTAFLGIIVHSTNMGFLLPEGKVAAIQEECRHLASSQVVALSQLSHTIGKLTFSKITVLRAPLHYRRIQHLKNSSTHLQVHCTVVNNVKIHVLLVRHTLEDLRWWVDNLSYKGHSTPSGKAYKKGPR